MHYALRLHLSHHGRAADAFVRFFDALEVPDHEARVGRAEGVLVPVRHASEWQDDFAHARSMRAAARIEGQRVSIHLDLAPLASVLVTIPTEREQLAVAITARIAGWLEVDFGVLQRMPDAAPTLLDTDADRLAYLAAASVNLVGERYEAVGPVAPGTRTILSPRLMGRSCSALRLEELQELSASSVAALQASGIGATFSQAPNGRRLMFAKGRQWVPPSRTTIHDTRDAAARDLEQRLALSSKEHELVDFEEPEIAPRASLRFLTAPDAKAEMLGLERAGLRWCLLDRATLSECAFIDCDLLGSSLAAARLLELRMVRCHASYVSFRHVVAVGSSFEACDLRATSFSGAELVDVRFRACDLREASFDGATFDRTTFDGCRVDVGTAGDIQGRGATVR